MSRQGPDPDGARVQRVRAGDVAAARELYDAHAPRVYRLAYRFAGDAARAEDWVQETFVRAFQRLHDFRGEAAFGAWLRAITVSVCLNGLRAARRRARHEVALEAAEGTAAEERRLRPGVADRLHAAVQALPERSRAVFILYDLEGYAHAEIAAMLGISEGNSKVILLRARTRLRETLSDLAEGWHA
ncbi:MAG TPA: sigma-70 family RNA polymerase sigma factor [Longimicrobium sp.]